MEHNKNSFYNELTKNLKQWEKTASSPEVSATNAPETQTAKEKTQTPQTVQVAEVLRELVKIAQELDNNGSTKAADLVDATIKKMAGDLDDELAEEETDPTFTGTEEGTGTRSRKDPLYEKEYEGAPEGLAPEDHGEQGPFNDDRIDALLADPTTRDYLKRKLQGL
jgi:hypothetical protein